MKTNTAALIIWWCEGTKARPDKRWKASKSMLCSVEVTNTDWRIVKIFADFLRNEVGIENSALRGQIQIHVGDNQNEIESHWSNMIGIPKAQFDRTIIRPVGNKPGKSKGTFKLRLYNKKVFLRLQAMLDEELRSIIGV